MAELTPVGAQPHLPIPPRPPHRPAHEQAVEDLQERLGQNEDRRRFLQERFRGLRETQAQLKADRERIGDERTLVDDRLVDINKQVEGKRNQLQKLRTGLPYLQEEEILNQIQNLEYQLRKNHYKPTEEKKIIQEIDRLNRSKKHLKDHNILKADLDHLRHCQREIREQRDLLFRQRGDIKCQEDIIKRDIHDIKSELEVLKVDIDALFNTKRQLVTDFKNKEFEHKKYLQDRREEQRLRRKEEREAYLAEKQKEIDEIKANADPYEEELRLIGNLINYCLRFEFPSQTSTCPSTKGDSWGTCNNGFLQIPGGDNPNPRRGSHESGLRKNSSDGRPSGSSNSSQYATPMGATPVTTPTLDLKDGGFTAYKKDETDEALFVGVGKKPNRKASRNERRNSKAKNLTHNPEIFSQFGALHLKPPASTKEVLEVVDSLKKQQGRFEAKAARVKEDRLKSSNASKSSPGLDNSAGNVQLHVETIELSPRDIPQCLEVTASYEPPSTQKSTCAARSSFEPDPNPSRTTLGGQAKRGKEHGANAPSGFNLDEAFPSLPEPTYVNAELFKSYSNQRTEPGRPNQASKV